LLLEKRNTNLTSKNTLQTSCRQNLYRYNGKEKDEHTGLYEYGQRYYAPWLCRFVSVDPIAEDYPQYTPYNYAGNKPITKIDQEGLQENGSEKGPPSSTNSNESSSFGSAQQNPVLKYNEVLGIHPSIVTYQEAQDLRAAALTTKDEHKSDSSRPEIGDKPESIISKTPQKESERTNPAPLDQVIKDGIKNSPTFAELAEINEISGMTFYSKVFYDIKAENSYTRPGTGEIVLSPKADAKEMMVELTHEMTNRSLLSEIDLNLSELKSGGKTPEEYAQFLIDLEFKGQVNQMKVASEIGYRFKKEGTEPLNNLLDRIDAGENIDLNTTLRPNPGLKPKYIENAKKIISQQ